MEVSEIAIDIGNIEVWYGFVVGKVKGKSCQ